MIEARLFLAALLLLVCHAAESTARVSLRGPNRGRKLQVDGVAPSAGIAAPIPPFSIQFTSVVSSDSDQDRIKTPLKLIAGEFLLENFRIALSRTTDDAGLLWFRAQFVTLRLSYSDLAAEPTSNNKQRITAVFQAEAVYRNGTYDADNKLSDSQIYDVSQGILLQAFAEDRKVLQQYLKESSDVVLRKHSMMSLQVGDQALRLINMHRSGNIQPVFLTAIIFVCLLGMIPLFLLLNKSYLHIDLKKRFLGGNRTDEYDSTVLAGRKTDDDENEASAMAAKVLHASDQYLSRHRPDLLDLSSPAKTTSSSAATSPSSTMSPSSPTSHKVISPSGWLKKTLLRRRGRLFGLDGLVRDREGAKYDFAFQDWSRKDGTPFWKSSESKQSPKLFPGDFEMHLAAMNGGSPKTKSMYSDDLFRRNLQSSFDDESYEIGSMTCVDDSEFSVCEAEAFMDKLEDLFHKKHRRYVKERMRNDSKFRMDEEARQRDRQLRRHEMELDLEAIEAQFSPRMANRTRQADIDIDLDSLPTTGRRMSGSFNSLSRNDGIKETIGIPRVAPTYRERGSMARSTSHGTLLTLDPPPLPPRATITPSVDATRGRTAAPQRRSRRSHSHGTNARKRGPQAPTGVDDVMTFGIAAYSKHLS